MNNLIEKAKKIWDPKIVNDVINNVNINGINIAWIDYLNKDLYNHKECAEFIYFATEEENQE